MHSMPNALFLHHGARTSRKREETVEAKKLLVDPLFCFPHATRLQKPTGKDARVRPPAVSAAAIGERLRPDWGAMCGTAKRLAVITVDWGNPNPIFQS
jgi:hypothetical protein